MMGKMNNRLRAGLVAAAVVATAAPLAAWAHQGPGAWGARCPAGPHAGWAGGHRWHHGHFDPQALQQHMDKRLSRLHADLHLSADQQAAWKSFTSSIKAQVQAMEQQVAQHIAAYKDHANKTRMSTPARLDARVQAMQARLDALKALDKATKTFYEKLSPTQQTIFDLEAPHRRAARGFWHHYR